MGAEPGGGAGGSKRFRSPMRGKDVGELWDAHLWIRFPGWVQGSWGGPGGFSAGALCCARGLSSSVAECQPAGQRGRSGRALERPPPLCIFLWPGGGCPFNPRQSRKCEKGQLFFMADFPVGFVSSQGPGQEPSPGASLDLRQPLENPV